MQSDIPMKEMVVQVLKSKLPENYYYHNYEHTLYVLDKVQEIGHYEKCTVAEMRLLIAAALWHDTGYITSYKGHEEESCRLAKKYLPMYGFSEEEMNIIFGIIMATKVPQQPTTKLEEILADADLEYLGTTTAAATSAKLFKELQSLDPELTKKEWNKLQISFLKTHHFFTQYCKEKKEPLQSAYLNQLINAT